MVRKREDGKEENKEEEEGRRRRKKNIRWRSNLRSFYLVINHFYFIRDFGGQVI